MRVRLFDDQTLPSITTFESSQHLFHGEMVSVAKDQSVWR
jgi:hypothetical protein